MKTEIVVFGGGCFWCMEAVFSMLKGVVSVMPGYAGGGEQKRIAGGSERSEGQGGPTYEQVSSGSTGHAEVIKIEYDSAIISYEDLLTVFFATHDPTSLNRQGADIGTQYRSIILYTDEAQKNDAENFIKKLNLASGTPSGKIVTEIKPLDKFYPAEDYHKDYFKKNPNQAYCQLVIVPKIEKLEKRFKELFR